MRLTDADKVINEIVHKYGLKYGDAILEIDNAPTIDAVPKNMIFHIEKFDKMTEEHILEEITLEELLNMFTDEGYLYIEDEDENF